MAAHDMSGMPDRFIASKRQFWREFIKLYQQMPELWDGHHADYRNKELRNESYEILQAKLREIQPNAKKTDVSRRINIFRTNYRREQMRIWKQQELGLHSDLCRPTLWFYDNMSFLLSQESFQSRTKRLRGQSCFKGKLNCTNVIDERTLDSLGKAAKVNFKETAETTTSGFDESLLLSPKIEILESKLEGLATDSVRHNESLQMDTADTSASDFNEPSCSTSIATVMKDSKCQQSTPPISESSEALAKSWAIQYEEMSPTQRILARKAIADILFEGCMGNLRINRGERNTIGNIV